ncbi:protein ENHANCED DOWNY MILDEW 2-like [Syzygium oleosum]|uniref:protein ENHANCED DOWNY MILDEW 2-like n=1 Tax=Syzygium oleosum TaxID=219896 RepID=UPI0024BAEB63|nr:protein ENHANCED DOWNY MILDEW 2-like [Syzygium oleosum]
MASSDDEAATLLETVSTYYFKDHDNKLVSFSVLPVRWTDQEDNEDAVAETIFLHGTADNGLRKIYREVKSWRFDLSCSRPEVSVLSKDNICYKLDKPRRSFHDTIRSVLIMLHCLHYAKNHPDASGEALWKHLARTLGFYEVQPSAKDLQDHVALIEEAIGREDALAKSKVLCKLMEEKPWERSKSGKNVAKPSSMVDDAEDVGMEDFEDGTAKEDDDKLRVYLAPFVYGMHYISFGRHFTKVDKLQEIVDKLHWYVRDGDMIVDFCCGANDFSCLMAKKLEETGKRCSYKNYNIFPPKNYFEFELRDWMTVQLKELPHGSNLIMGLNPPFGVRAALANKFIDKALEFKPKLLILIVPSETERLDEKMFRYDLVWEDHRFLSGKSFYLPGSIDVEDKQIEQWNNKPPLLYLWSRRDWTAKHRTIAQKQGHLPTKRKRPLSSDDRNGSLDLRYPKDDRSFCVDTSSLTSDTSMPMGRPEETKDRVDTAEGQKRCFSRNDSGRESRESQATGTSTGKANGIGTSGREIYEKSPAKETPHRPSLKLADGKSSFDDRSSKQKADASGTRRREIGEKDLPRCPSPNWTNGESSFNDWSTRGKAGGRGIRGREIDEEPPAKVTSRLPSPKSSVNDRSSRSREVLFEKDARGSMNYQHAGLSMSMSHAENFYGGQGSTLSDDASRMYGLNNNEHYSTQRWSSGGGPLTIHGVRNLERPHIAHMRDTDDCRLNVAEPYWRDLEMRLLVRLYGQQDPNVSQRNYMASHDPGYDQPGPLTSTYGLPGSIAESSQQANMSAMERYAPHLDEQNPTRTNNARPEGTVIRGNRFLDPNGGPQFGYQCDSFGFATGPHWPYSQQNTSGWLDE